MSLAVSPFGFEDVGAWWSSAVWRCGGGSVDGSNDSASDNSNADGNVALNGRRNKDVFGCPAVKIHSTKLSISVNIDAAADTTATTIDLCLYNDKSVEIVCSPVSSSECGEPFAVNLGPEAGGMYLLTADDAIAIEFEVVAGDPISNKCGSHRKDTQKHAPGERPPIDIPDHMCLEYTLGDTVPVSGWYFDDKSDKPESYQPRSRNEINNFMEMAKSRREYYYGPTDTWLYNAIDAYPIRGKRVLIVGSNVPWYER